MSDKDLKTELENVRANLNWRKADRACEQQQSQGVQRERA